MSEIEDKSLEFIQQLLSSLTDEERRQLFRLFCQHCGTKEMPCNCWNDD